MISALSGHCGVLTPDPTKSSKGGKARVPGRLQKGAPLVSWESRGLRNGIQLEARWCCRVFRVRGRTSAWSSTCSSASLNIPNNAPGWCHERPEHVQTVLQKGLLVVTSTQTAATCLFVTMPRQNVCLALSFRFLTPPGPA